MTHTQPTGEAIVAAPVPSEFALVPLAELREHEEVVDDGTVKALAERLQRDGFIFQPIVADRATRVVLDGHHRLNALRFLGMRLAPVNLVDYRDERIRVASWRAGAAPPTKDEVVRRALEGRPFPPKSTRHDSLYDLPRRHVPLGDLR